MKISEQVKEFHKAMNLPIGTVPKVPSDDRVRLRLRLIMEEAFETLDAALSPGEQIEQLKLEVMKLIDELDIDVDMYEFVDGLGDLDYVNEGARIEFGVNGEPIADAIQAANMRKVGGPKRADGKAMKPPNWYGPEEDILKVLKDQGWQG